MRSIMIHKIFEREEYCLNSCEISTTPISTIIVWPTRDALGQTLEENNALLNPYCSAFVPFLLDPYTPSQDNYLLVYLHDPQDCYSYGKVLEEYYNNNFEHLCHRSNFIATLVKEALSENGIPLDLECNSHTKTFLFITPVQIQEIYLFMFMIIFLFSVIVDFYISKNRKVIKD